MTSATFASELSAKNNLESCFAAINWQARWLTHLTQLSYLSTTISQLIVGNELCQQQTDATNDNRQIDSIAKVLNDALKQQSEESQTSLPSTRPTANDQAHSLNFVSQNALPEGIGYEQFIGSTGNIPTRDNLHDLFNGSIWLTFPKTKAMLNYHHMLEIAKQDSNNSDVNQSRGRVRDTITVFDENGAILVTADPSIGKALINFDWQASLVTPRDKFDNPIFGNKKQPNSDEKAAVYIFGHALLEQLIEPRKALCAHSVVINVEQDFFTLTLSERMSYLDNKLANVMNKLLSQDNITPRQLAPLPILGVPHFWSENADPSFYKDAYVFRNGRRKS